MTLLKLAALAGMAALFPVTTLAEMNWSVEMEATRTTGADSGNTINLYPTLTHTIPLSGAWSLGIEANPEIYVSRTPRGWHLDDPFLGIILTAQDDGRSFGVDIGATWLRDDDRFTDANVILFAEGAWGRLDAGDTDGALGDACLTPDIGTLDDLALASACPGQLATGVVRYSLPEGPTALSVSLAQHDGDRGASIALSQTKGSLQWGLAAESVPGHGTATPRTATQGALLWTGEIWTLGLAAAHVSTAGRNPWAARAAATLSLRENLTMTLGLSTGRLTTDDDGGGLERGAGLSGAWVLNDQTTLTGGIARRWVQGAAPETLLAASVTLTR